MHHNIIIIASYIEWVGRNGKREERGSPSMLPWNLLSISLSISCGSFQFPRTDSTRGAGVGTESSFFVVHTYVCFSTRATSSGDVMAR